MNKQIKVIEGLEPWEVMKRASEGEPVWVTHKGIALERGWDCNYISASWCWSKYDYFVIDTSTPDFHWDDVDYPFFNQYGGLPALCNLKTAPTYEHVLVHSPNDDSIWSVRPSPWYAWQGGECPVPKNWMVMLIRRNGAEYLPINAGSIGWDHRFDKDDVIQFRLTGRVL